MAPVRWNGPAAVAGPIEGTSLKSELQLQGCNYLSPEQVEQMKKMFAPPYSGLALASLPTWFPLRAKRDLV
jgi:hypothetical protein